MLLSRLLDTGIGIAVGLLVNLLVWPPLRDRSAAHQIDALDDRIGELLSEMAEGGDPEAWIARTREIDDDIDSAWGVVRQARESGRLNPRRAARGRMEAAEHFEALLHRIEQANAETRSMARTIHLADMPPAAWPPTFRAPWLVLLGRAGRAITDADRGAIDTLRADLDAFAGELALDELPERFWPVAGALLVNLRNVLASLDEVADAQPVQVPAPALAGAHPSVRSRL
jgi:uncharacterized membrane protein YccC